MSNLFYRNPRLMVLTIALIVVAGVAAFHTLPRTEDPRFTVRAAAVVTQLPGASAQRVETLVTDKLEGELLELEYVRSIVSQSRSGTSILNVELHDWVGPGEADNAWSLVRDRLDDAAALLPPEASPPDFNNQDMFAVTVIAAVTWDQAMLGPPNYAILGRIADQLDDELRAMPGAERTKVFGRPKEEIRVEVNPSRLAQLGMTTSDLARRIAASDVKVAAGRMRGSDDALLVEVQGEVRDLDRIARIPLKGGANGSFATLGDVATITKAVADPPDEITTISGKPGIAVIARMAPDRRVDQWTARASRIVKDFDKNLSPGMEARLIFNQNDYTGERLTGLATNFLLGNLAVFAVVLLMMGWRSAIVVAMTLPLTSLMVLAGLKFMGAPIHQMSITGLIVALGLLIDNAVVMVDETRRRIEAGAKAGDAVTAAVKELCLPLLGSTLTTVFAFMPIYLMPGAAGEFVGTIALSVIIAVLASLFLSLTVAPAMTALMSGKRSGGSASTSTGTSSSTSTGGSSFSSAFKSSRSDASRSWWRHGVNTPAGERFYDKLLALAFRHPAKAAIIAILPAVAGFIGAGTLTEQFFPPADRAQFQLQLRLPRQTPIYRTADYAERVRRLLMADKAVREVHFFIGGDAPMFYYNVVAGEDDSPFFAHAIVEMYDAHGGAKTIRRLQNELDQKIPEAQALALQLEQGPPFLAPVEMKLFGPDIDTLREVGDDARRILAGSLNVTHTRNTLVDGNPKLWIQLDEDRVRLAGLDNVSVAKQLEATLEGAVGGSMIEGAEELPIRVRIDGNEAQSAESIASLDLFAPAGSNAGNNGNNGTNSHAVDSVPLEALGQMKLRPEIAAIDRINGRRVNRILGYVSAGTLPAIALNDFRTRLAEENFALPTGYEIVWGGESDERDRAVGNLLSSVAILMTLMAATLVLSLKSFRLAGIIGVVGVASMGLGVGSLYLCGFPFGFMAIVGTMGLVGVAINDSIVVLTAISRDPDASRGRPDAVRRVVKQSTRHVLSTTFTTVAGFAPLLIAGGLFWPPLAVTIAIGVFGATLLALTFVPSAYLVMQRGRETRLASLRPRMLTDDDTATPETAWPAAHHQLPSTR